MLTPAVQRSPRLAHGIAIASLTILFLWVYGRCVGGLYFVMDDFIHTAGEMTGPLWATLRATFSGSLAWSGYRPLSTSLRVLLTHAFGLERMWGYYAIYLSLHLVNTLLAYRIVRRVGRSTLWAFMAAAIVLLLPSHNEAILWFAASSNVLALLFALLALDLALTAIDKPGPWPAAGAALAYICAVLSYEVTLPLPLLICAADWICSGRAVRRRAGMYALLGLSALLLLGLRIAVQGGSLAPARSDYAASLAPGHILRGYQFLFSQIVLLYTSPYPGAPLYAWQRNWLAPTGPLALTTIGLTLVLVTAVIASTRHAGRAPRAHAQAMPSAELWLWCAWGLLWMVVMGLAFASLTGRNPENRYTYLLSFGFAVSLSALGAALSRALQRVRILRFAPHALMAGLIAFYAYTSAGDVQDWVAAGAVVRTTLASIHAALPTLEPDQAIGQIGIPARVGSAYTFTIEPAFQAAMQLLYGQGRPGFADNDTLRAWFTDDPDRGERTYAFAWDAEAQTTVPLVAVILCKTYDDCRYFDLRRPEGSSKNRGLRYVQIYDTENPQLGGVALLASLQPYAVRSCYIFQDYNVYTAPAAFYDYPQDQRCADAVTAFWDFSE